VLQKAGVKIGKRSMGALCSKVKRILGCRQQVGELRYSVRVLGPTNGDLVLKYLLSRGLKE
jgi:hypothetical protein